MTFSGFSGAKICQICKMGKRLMSNYFRNFGSEFENDRNTSKGRIKGSGRGFSIKSISEKDTALEFVVVDG